MLGFPFNSGPKLYGQQPTYTPEHLVELSMASRQTRYYTGIYAYRRKQPLEQSKILRNRSAHTSKNLRKMSTSHHCTIYDISVVFPTSLYRRMSEWITRWVHAPNDA